MNIVLFLKRHWLSIVSLVIIIYLLTFFHFKGIIFYDEGYILNSGVRIIHGQIPYRDFDIAYTPLTSVITSWFLFVFGESVFSGRLAAMAISLLSLFAIFKILQQITKNKYLIFMCLLFFIAWGPAHINFPWPTMFAICFLLYTLLFLLLGAKQKNISYFYYAGITTALTFLSKQNFGFGVFVACLIFFLFSYTYKNRSTITGYLLGIGSICLLTICVGIATGSLFPFVNNLYIYTFKRILIDKAIDTPFLYEGSWLTKLLKFILYTAPLTLSSIAFFVVRTSQKKLIIIPLFVGIFYFLGIRPTTDYNHLVPLLAICCLPLALIITTVKKGIFKTGFVFFLLCMTMLGLYTAYFKNYYKWESPLSINTYFADNSHLRIFIEKDKIKNIDALTSYIDSHTKSDDNILVTIYSPMVYFLTNRENPTRYDLINPNDIPVSYQKDVIFELKKKNVPLVVETDVISDKTSIIGKYIKVNYPVKKVVGGFIIFQKSSTK